MTKKINWKGESTERKEKQCKLRLMAENKGELRIKYAKMYPGGSRARGIS